MMENFKKNRALRKGLERTLESLKWVHNVDAKVKISIYDIKTGVNASVNGGNKGWAASIIKVPILVEVAKQICDGRIAVDEKLEVNHNFVLEEFDPVSMMAHGTKIGVVELMQYMVVNSDNTATNMLADRAGIENINQTMWDLGMKRSMLGHLLCPRVPRYTRWFNRDGSNITRPDDMTKLFRHIYDPKFSQLSKQVRELSDAILSLTHPIYLNTGKFAKAKVKAKIGVIRDPIDGADIHEVGIIDNHLIVSIMLNKIDQNSTGQGLYSDLDELCQPDYTLPVYAPTEIVLSNRTIETGIQSRPSNELKLPDLTPPPIILPKVTGSYQPVNQRYKAVRSRYGGRPIKFTPVKVVYDKIMKTVEEHFVN